MKQTFILILAFFPLILSCERNDDKMNKDRNSYILAGDTIDCNYVDFNPDIIFNSESDSFDINFDTRFDIEFKVNFVFIYDCEEVYANCPPEMICDCWPTIYTDYLINLALNTEIAIDADSAIHEFMINDTISNKNIWSCHSKYPIYHRTEYNNNWTGSCDMILGLRKIQTPDTLYSWISIRIENSGIIINKMSMQNN